MPKTWTAEEIFESARSIAMAPNTRASGSDDAALLRHLNEYLQDELLPQILAVREDYFTRTKRYTVAAGTTRVRIDPRAVLSKIDDCRLYDGNGDLVRGFSQISQSKTPPPKISASLERPYGWVIEGVEILLWPPPAAFSGTLEVSFPLRPSDLVLSSLARKITSISYNSGLDETTIGFESSITGSNVSQGGTVDIHSQHSGAELKAWGRSTAVPGGGGGGVGPSSVIVIGTLDGSLSGERAVEVGDWCCGEGESAIPGVPREFHPILSRAVALGLSESMKDSEGMQAHAARLQGKVRAQIGNMEPRASKSKTRVVGASFISTQRRVY